MIHNQSCILNIADNFINPDKKVQETNHAAESSKTSSPIIIQSHNFPKLKHTTQDKKNALLTQNKTSSPEPTNNNVR